VYVSLCVVSLYVVLKSIVSHSSPVNSLFFMDPTTSN